jgi:hypothetical protein
MPLQLSSSSVCLADYCPIFGSCGGKPASNSGRSYVSKSKTAFHNIISCSAGEIEKSRYKCEALATNCFVDESIRQRFVSKVCGSLRCEHGILKGYTPPADKPEGSGDATLVIAILKGIFIAVILLFVVFYGFSTGVFSSSRGRRKKKQF